MSDTHAGHKELSFVVTFSHPHTGATAHVQEETHPIQQAAEMFAAGVAKRTHGELNIKLFPTSTLYSQQETIEKTMRGILDISAFTQGILDKYVNVLAMVMLPFLFDGYAHAYRVLDGAFAEWSASLLRQKQLAFLSNWEWGFRHLTNNVRPIHVPADLKGLNIRMPLRETNIRMFLEVCEATPVELDLCDVHEALKQNRADGQENPLEVLYRFKFYEVQKYLSLTHHSYNCMMHVMSLKSWNKLPPEQQHIVQDESRKAGDFLRRAIRDDERQLLEKLRAKGMLIVEPDIAAFRAMTQPAYQSVKNFVGADVFEKFMRLVEQER